MNKRKTTTISCDEEARHFVATEAERLKVTQRQAVDAILNEYRKYTNMQGERKKTALDLIKEVNTKLEATCTSNATVVSTMKEVEEFISSMSANQQVILDLLHTMIETINSINSISGYDTKNFIEN